MQANAVLLNKPREIAFDRIDLDAPSAADVVVETEWSGISTGTERLLWSGRMPDFPGMGYPLVPGYEAIGRVVAGGADVAIPVGTRVFVPGAQCFGTIRGLFGAAASRLVTPAARVLPLRGAFASDGEPDAILLALAATAQHALATGPAGAASPLPELIVGHGVLGRLLARLAVAAGGNPVVWERNPHRSSGAVGYQVLDPDCDPRRDYHTIIDVSGDSGLLDALIGRLAVGGELVLAGFYPGTLQFAFPAAFRRELRLRVAAEWQRQDLVAVHEMAVSGKLSLSGLISHRRPAAEAPHAYAEAFEDADCIKMALNWRARA